MVVAFLVAGWFVVCGLWCAVCCLIVLSLDACLRGFAVCCVSVCLLDSLL